MGKDFDWEEANRQAAEKERKARAKRDEETQRRLDEEAEIEDLEDLTDADMDAETMQIIADMGIKIEDFDKILNTRYDDKDVQASVDAVNAAKKKWTKSGRRSATKRAVKRNKKNLKKANKARGKGCAVVAIAMIGGVMSVLSAAGWGTYEIVSRLI